MPQTTDNKATAESNRLNRSTVTGLAALTAVGVGAYLLSSHSQSTPPAPNDLGALTVPAATADASTNEFRQLPHHRRFVSFQDDAAIMGIRQQQGFNPYGVETDASHSVGKSFK